MKMIKITQIKSSVNCMQTHRDTVKALGLRRIRQVVFHNDTPQIRGMMKAVNYLLSWELTDEKPVPKTKKPNAKGYTVVKK
jgi:large subunit ribosomal protein L30